MERHRRHVCRQEGVGRYVFASSIYVQSEAGSFYRVSKQACELYIEEYHREVAGRLAEMSDEDVRMAAGVIHDAYQILSGGEAGMR